MGPPSSPASAPRRRRTLRPRWAGPLGLYVPGTSWVHRLGAGWKLLALAAVSVVVTWTQQPVVAVCALGAAVAVLMVARVPLRATARTLAPVVVVVLGLGAYQWWARGWQDALVVSAGLLAVIGLATCLTATTRSDQLLEAMTRTAGPLRHVGLRPQTFALAVSLVLRTIPALIDLGWDVRDAARARGLDRSPRALLVPFVLRAVARAHTTADALAARGVLDDDDADSGDDSSGPRSDGGDDGVRAV
ncbi:energy-coupling factor transporter transmembrane component T family protein [Sanguibacter suarezii]|uniref:energy-coupling factor transporter transmembrane component T family protein n=1 Tax=Sanguibacter suarezii TaxID=60921 RepID=UPI000A07370B|nr:energy-coupling factor transporter transmembrane protein EcfT [Sanguibacter suarezii]